MQSSLRSSISQQLTTHAILLFTWGLLYVQVLPLLTLDSTDGKILVGAVVVVFFGATLSWVISRFLFFGTLGNFLNSIKYFQVEQETIRNLCAQDLFDLALDNWEKSWKNNGLHSRLFTYLKYFGEGLLASSLPWIISLLLGVLFLMLHVIV
jgi:hypothetical protein